MSLLFLGLLLGQALTANAQPFSATDCDMSVTHRILASDANPKLDARAYWLDRNTLQWPGLPADAKLILRSAETTYQTTPSRDSLPAAFRFIGDGPRFDVTLDDPAAAMSSDLIAEASDSSGRVIDRSRLQNPGALDDLFASAASEPHLGISTDRSRTTFKLWAPTARQVGVCIYQQGRPASLVEMSIDRSTGIYSTTVNGDLFGQHYLYLIDVFMPGHGMVRNLVTDPYSVSLNTDSKRSWIGDMNDVRLKPNGWDAHASPKTVRYNTDMVIYELHVRDFSRDDRSVPAPHRGKFIAFADTRSDGMKHLQSLAQSGLTDVHLLPIFDFATLPERGCINPKIPNAAGDSARQQAAIKDVRDRDCYNWGYEPYHFNAVEGSYATDPSNGATRIIELRKAVMALHKIGLRVGMDVVYNHTNAAGLQERSTLDRIVPGYYHRRDETGNIERSTCCENTATEHLMMAKLMEDSVAFWTRNYRIDSFRFDLMGHQPRAAMEATQNAARKANGGRDVQFLGEGWNFGEVADGKRFVQASQLSLNGSGIGTFSDRMRDAVRGGSAGDSGADLPNNPGFIHQRLSRKDGALWDYADWVRIGMAGTIKDYRLPDRSGRIKTAAEFNYKGAPAGYVAQPTEVVNYVENHDNQTLFDLNAIRMPTSSSAADRAQAQWLAIAINAVSQGIAYFHAGVELLRSKSLDRNSYNSGDWFNRLDWTGRTNYFATGLPPQWDNESSWPQMRAALNNVNNRVSRADIAATQQVFKDWLAIRASSSLFRMHTAADISARLKFPQQFVTRDPNLIVAQYDGAGYTGANFDQLLVIINSSSFDKTIPLPPGKWKLHPVLASKNAGDIRPRQVNLAESRIQVPGFIALVLVRD